MEVRIAARLVAVLLLFMCCTLEGEAQLSCHRIERCEDTSIGTFSTVQDCCLQETARFHTGGTDSELCIECIVYGWLNTFPIEVYKGDTVELEIGIFKGQFDSVRQVRVDFNSTEVSVSRDTVTLGVDVETVTVTVEDDGAIVTEERNITLTLVQLHGKSDDIINTEARLVLQAQKIPTVTVGFNSSGYTAAESEGEVSVCVFAAASTTSATSTVSVSLSVTGGSADTSDYSLPDSLTMELTSNTTNCIQIILSTADNHETAETITLLLSTSDANVDIVRNATQVTILDSDEAVIVVDPEMEMVREGETDVKSVCISVNNSVVDVPVTYIGDLEQFAADTIPVGLETELTLRAMGPPVCVEYTIVDDAEVEGTEILIVSFVGLGPRVQSATFTLIIEDNDMMPSPSPSPSPPTKSSVLPPSPTPTPTPTPTRRLSLPQNIADTVSGGAFIATLINAHSTDTDSPMEMALCYEIHGDQGRYFNLVSEPCLSINAHYLLQDPDKPLHFIDEIAVVATNAAGENVEMFIDRNCNLAVNGEATQFFNSSGVSVEAIPFFSDVVIVSDGGSGRRTEMVVGCAAGEHGLMQLDIERDSVVVNSSSHGLLGQFWGQPISVTNYGEAPDDYLIDIPHHGNQQHRQIVGSSYSTTWEYRKLKCLYLGDRQGGRGAGLHEGPNEPLIEGEYTDYVTSGPFDTNFKYSRFDM